jgi:hypothetical protein
LEKVGLDITRQTLRENVQTNQLVTNDTTLYVYGKAMLVVAFDNSMRIITIPYMGFSCFVDSIVGEMRLIGEQNVTNHMGVRINSTAQFQPATHVRRRAREKNYSSEFSVLQEASTMLHCFVRLQVLWSHESENVSTQMEDTSNSLLEC